MLDKIKNYIDMGKYEDLEKEQRQAWGRIVNIEEKVEVITNDWAAILKDPTQVTKTDASTTKRYRTNAKTALEELQKTKQQIEGIESQLVQVTESNTRLLTEAENTRQLLDKSKKTLNERADLLQGKLEFFDSIIESYPDLEESLAELGTTVEQGNELFTKAFNVHKSILNRKTEVDEIYYDIHGYIDEDDEGNEVKIEGKVDSLTSTYDHLENLAAKIEGKQKQQISDVDEKIQGKIDSWEKTFSDLTKQVRDLMPEALTKGLSEAYSKKKSDEESTLSNYEKTFKKSIKAAVGISLIPFAVASYMLFTGEDLHDLVMKGPRMALSVLPIYIPVIWMAYSADKKAKLSKRLIEEYTHKEVLSKTYEGLSTQVEALTDDQISADLRIKLLTNILNVSGENPGKLISDYNKSDHPIIDVLEKSNNLSESFERLLGIPGIEKLVGKLVKKTNTTNKKTERKSKDGLDQLGDD